MMFLMEEEMKMPPNSQQPNKVEADMLNMGSVVQLHLLMLLCFLFFFFATPSILVSF